jgi:hypothetical protein
VLSLLCTLSYTNTHELSHVCARVHARLCSLSLSLSLLPSQTHSNSLELTNSLTLPLRIHTQNAKAQIHSTLTLSHSLSLSLFLSLSPSLSSFSLSLSQNAKAQIQSILSMLQEEIETEQSPLQPPRRCIVLLYYINRNRPVPLRNRTSVLYCTYCLFFVCIATASKVTYTHIHPMLLVALGATCNVLYVLCMYSSRPFGKPMYHIHRRESCSW